MAGVKYTDEFKHNAVSLVDAGSSVAKVARDLNVPPNQLYEWRKRFRQGRPKPGPVVHTQEEVSQLKRELARTQMELDIIKKALGIFSRSAQ